MANTINVSPGQAVAPNDWNALLLQHGNLPQNAQPQMLPIDDPLVEPLLMQPGMAAYLRQHPPYRYYMEDGTSVVAFGMADGQNVQILDYKPSPKFQTVQKEAEKEPPKSARRTRDDYEGTPTGRTNPDGTPEYDNERPRKITRDIQTNEVLDDKPLAGTELDDWRAARERSRNPGGKTDKELADAQKPATTGSGTKIDSRTEVKDGRQVTVETWRLPDGTTEERRSDEPAPASTTKTPTTANATEPLKDAPGWQVGKRVKKDAQGNETSETFYIDPQGNETRTPPPALVKATPTQIITDPETKEQREVIRNPDGSIKELRPLPGSRPNGPVTPAPSLPQIVVGSSQDALRTAYDDIQAEVDAGRRTPAWGENRRKEVMEAARLTVQEAQLHEQSRQSNQTASLNGALYGQNALESSMRFALQINGKLKKGSAAGANLFRAMFTMQMKMLADSGFDPGGGRSSVGTGYPNAPGVRGAASGASSQADRRPPPRITNIGDPAKVAEQADKAEADLAGHPVLNPQSAAPSSFPITPNAAETSTQSSTAPAPPPPVPAPAVGAGQPNASPVMGVPAQPGQITIRRLEVGPGGGTPGYTTRRSQKDLDTMTPEERARWEIVPDAAPAPTASIGAPATGEPTMPRQMAPEMYGHTAENPMATPGSGMQYPALEQFRMGDTPPSIEPITTPPQMAPNPMDQQMAPALQLAQIRATPPWRLPPDQLQGLIDQYGEQDVMWHPTRDLMGV